MEILFKLPEHVNYPNLNLTLSAVPSCVQDNRSNYPGGAK